ncbi:MAG: tetratricopeptide repeat protein [Ignavibacteriae bacterium]|nr:tetratricopeptide repeat protein [Ignavibacteriota bacterium]
MEAIVSGSAGKAFVLDNDLLHVISVADPKNPKPATKNDLYQLVHELGNLEFLEDVNYSQVELELKKEYELTYALDLSLVSFDSKVQNSTRVKAINHLENLIRDASLLTQVQYVLFSVPRPSSADIEGALDLSTKLKASATKSLLKELLARQSVIKKVHSAWETIEVTVFGGRSEKKLFENTIIREGLFYDFVMCLTNEEGLGKFKMKSLSNKKIGALPNFRTVLYSWISPFSEITKTEQDHFADKSRSVDVKLFKYRKIKRERRGIDRASVLEKVESQKEYIIAKMERGDLHSAKRVVNELIEFQLKNGKPEFVVKSLCDLAIAAKRLHSFAFQLELTQRSVNLKPNDGWAWAQYGDALLNMGQPKEASRAFDQADFFGEGLIAEGGKIEVLKTVGRLDEALFACNNLIAKNPFNIVTYASRAEILATLGRLEEAYQAYEDIITILPNDAITKTGRAGILKSMGRFEEALKAYDDVLSEYPGDIVALSGRAGALKSLGHLDDALGVYDAILFEYPSDIPAKFGRCSILATKGDYSKALEDLVIPNPITKDDWVGLHIRGMIMLRLGEIDEARKIFLRGVNENPWVLEREYFKTALSLTYLRQKQFSEAEEALVQIISTNLQFPVNVFHLHSFGAMGKKADALKSYQKIITLNQQSRAEDLIKELKRRYITDESPSHDDEWVINREIDILLLAA